MSLWVDAQHPSSLDELDYHPHITAQLRTIVTHNRGGHLTGENNFPHLLFTGPKGSGKQTRVSALLRALYHTDLTEHDKLRLEYKSIKINDSKTVEVTLLSSPYHIELNLSEVGPTSDRVVIMTLIKEIAQTTSISTRIHFEKEKEDNLRDEVHRPSFRVLVLHQVELLSRGAQQALRRTMEKYVQSCRLILISSGGPGAGRIIAPIRSRCLEIRIPAPSDTEIERIMLQMLRNEGESVKGETSSLFPAILSNANGDLRRALLLLESYWRNDKQIIEFPWKIAIQNICLKVKKEQTPKQLHDIRTNLYDLLQSCVPGDVIIKEMSLHFAEKMAGNCEPAVAETISAAALYEHNVHLGTRAVVHIEAFLATLMAILKKYKLNLK